MRIGFNALILRPGAYSGVHVAVRGMARALARRLPPGDELVCYAQRGLPDDQLPPEGGKVGLRRIGFPASWRLGRILWEEYALPRALARDRVDVFCAPAYAAPARTGVPLVLGVHDIFGLAAPELATAANRRHLRRRMPAALRAAARIVVPTAAVADDLARWRASPDPLAAAAGPADALAAKTRVVPWGVDERFFADFPPAARDELARRLRLPPKFVLLVARPEPKKNLALALRAYFAAVAATGLPHRLVMVGPPGWGVEKKLSRLAGELGLGERLHRLGFVSDADMPGLYRMASALLFPSLAEGFGLPVLEAMASGCPVIAAPVPAVVEVAGRDGARWAHPTDLAAWRTAIEEVLADSPTARRLADAGRRRAAEFTWDVHADALRTVFREALE